MWEEKTVDNCEERKHLITLVFQVVHMFQELTNPNKSEIHTESYEISETEVVFPVGKNQE